MLKCVVVLLVVFACITGSTVVAGESDVNTPSTVLVSTPSAGDITGVKHVLDDERTLLFFKNIPYAKPPVGQLRFAKPEPRPKFDSPFDATRQDMVFCPNPDGYIPLPIQNTEDCLVLHITLTKSQTTDDQSEDGGDGETLKKVLIYFHGGGFIGGAGEPFLFDGTSFTGSQDVIFVSVNYRLGILGFLSTENEASPGNYGLWDQVLAIRWIKDNIGAFGGDPNGITISGQSAGGATVDYLSISPHANGLFQRGYVQSSTATGYYARSNEPGKDAVEIAQTLGCLEKDFDGELDLELSRSVVECLRTKPMSSFTAFNKYDVFSNYFVPTVDGDFIPDLPIKLHRDESYLQSVGFFDRSYLVVINNNEVAEEDIDLENIRKKIFGDKKKSLAQKKAIFKKYVSEKERRHILTHVGLDETSGKDVVDKVKDFYSRRFEFPRDFTEMVSDLYFLISSYDMLAPASRNESCNSYLLYFDYFPSFMKGEERGMIHAGEFPFFFDIDLEKFEALFQVGARGELSAEDLKMREMFSSIVGEFVRSGNPGQALKDVLPSWPRFDEKHGGHYLNLSPPRPWVGSFLGKNIRDFWMETIPEMVKEIKLSIEGGGSCSVDDGSSCHP